MDGVFNFAFAFTWTTISDKNKKKLKFLCQKHVFKQNSKISGIPSLHHFIPAIVIIIEKESNFPKMHPYKITAIEN